MQEIEMEREAVFWLTQLPAAGISHWTTGPAS
jgi:hypothetical protein